MFETRQFEVLLDQMKLAHKQMMSSFFEPDYLDVLYNFVVKDEVLTYSDLFKQYSDELIHAIPVPLHVNHDLVYRLQRYILLLIEFKTDYQHSRHPIYDFFFSPHFFPCEADLLITTFDHYLEINQLQLINKVYKAQSSRFKQNQLKKLYKNYNQHKGEYEKLKTNNTQMLNDITTLQDFPTIWSGSYPLLLLQSMFKKLVYRIDKALNDHEDPENVFSVTECLHTEIIELKERTKVLNAEIEINLTLSGERQTTAPKQGISSKTPRVELIFKMDYAAAVAKGFNLMNQVDQTLTYASFGESEWKKQVKRTHAICKKVRAKYAELKRMTINLSLIILGDEDLQTFNDLLKQYFDQLSIMRDKHNSLRWYFADGPSEMIHTAVFGFFNFPAYVLRGHSIDEEARKGKYGIDTTVLLFQEWYRGHMLELNSELTSILDKTKVDLISSKQQVEKMTQYPELSYKEQCKLSLISMQLQEAKAAFVAEPKNMSLLTEMKKVRLANSILKSIGEILGKKQDASEDNCRQQLRYQVELLRKLYPLPDIHFEMISGVITNHSEGRPLIRPQCNILTLFQPRPTLPPYLTARIPLTALTLVGEADEEETREDNATDFHL